MWVSNILIWQYRTLVLQSKIYNQGIPEFSLMINEDFSFSAYHFGIKTAIKSLSKIKVCHLNAKSKLIEAINFLKNLEKDHKKNVLIDQISSMGSLSYIGEKKYSDDTFVRSFEHLAISRSLYT